MKNFFMVFAPEGSDLPATPMHGAQGARHPQRPGQHQQRLRPDLLARIFGCFVHGIPEFFGGLVQLAVASARCSRKAPRRSAISWTASRFSKISCSRSPTLSADSVVVRPTCSTGSEKPQLVSGALTLCAMAMWRLRQMTRDAVGANERGWQRHLRCGRRFGHGRRPLQRLVEHLGVAMGPDGMPNKRFCCTSHS